MSMPYQMPGKAEGQLKRPPVIVAVTAEDFGKAESVFRSTPGASCISVPGPEEQLAAAIRAAAARAVVIGPKPYRDALYHALPRGGVIARFGVGHDGVDKALATQNGLLCTNTPGVLDQSVAELAMALILAAARHVVSLTTQMKDGRWAPQAGIEMKGRTLAIIGCGRIGSALARIASQGFDMQVRCVGRRDDYESAVSNADFVSLHIPATPENVSYIDHKRLAVLSSRSWLINTARGAVVDERALYDTLTTRRIAGAAIDVFETEPYTPKDPARDLRTLENVILTPHVGSYTPEANHRMARRALRNILLAEAGEFGAMDLVNPEVLVP